MKTKLFEGVERLERDEQEEVERTFNERVWEIQSFMRDEFAEAEEDFTLAKELFCRAICNYTGRRYFDLLPKARQYALYCAEELIRLAAMAGKAMTCEEET